MHKFNPEFSRLEDRVSLAGMGSSFLVPPTLVNPPPPISPVSSPTTPSPKLGNPLNPVNPTNPGANTPFAPVQSYPIKGIDLPNANPLTTGTILIA